MFVKLCWRIVRRWSARFLRIYCLARGRCVNVLCRHSPHICCEALLIALHLCIALAKCLRGSVSAAFDIRLLFHLLSWLYVEVLLHLAATARYCQLLVQIFLAPLSPCNVAQT